METSSIPPFDYIMDNRQLVYISMGLEYNEQLYAALVYAPSAQGYKSCVYNDLSYTKRIYEGLDCQKELLVTPTLLPHAEYLQSLHAVSDIGEEILLVPKDFITQHVPAQQVFQDVIEVANPAQRLTIKAAEIMESFGFDKRCIGLYGGIAAGLQHKVPLATGRLVNDIDFVINGLEKYDTVHDILQQQGVYINNGSDHLLDPQKYEIILNRWQISCFKLLDDIGCDIRFSRNENDSNSYLSALKQATGSREIVSLQHLRVLRSPESLTIPVGYILESDSGERCMVTSLYYKFLGCVREGDIVDVTGLGINGYMTTIVLTDTKRHYIRKTA